MKSSKTGNELEKLRETYLVSPETAKYGYHKLTESELVHYHIPTTEKLTESLNENILSKVSDEKLRSQLQKMFETNVKSGYPVWKVPISKFTKNGNGRIYSKKLWENVINKQRENWQGLYGLMDHPVGDSDPGSMKNIASVWHDMMIEGDTVFGICSLVGDNGKLIDDILSVGGRAGTSTSGFGEVDKITREVDPDTFVCERASDWVINPSQGTYATIDCPHTPSEFLDNVHQGATIEFGKQPVRESTNIRSKIMAAKFDAAAPVQESAPAQSLKEAQGSEKKEQRVLSKMEEKFYRKTVEKLLNEADELENPLARLNECMDILDCFEEGLLPDLKESIESKLKDLKVKLEEKIEKVTKTEQDFGMDLDKFRERTEKTVAQGMYFKEQVTDYKVLVESLQERNKKLLEEVNNLKDKLQISEKLNEKKIFNANKEIVNTSTEVENLNESLERATSEIVSLKNMVKKLSEGNSHFEKENGLLDTKLREAVEIIRTNKDKRLQESEINKSAYEKIRLLESRVADLEKTNKELDNQYTIQSNRFDKLQETFEAYKTEVNNTYNPMAHALPTSTERVGKYLNLVESKGISIENYWIDLKEQYGEAIDPYEDKIRGAKTLREATEFFLRVRSQIDKDFELGQPAEFTYHSRNDRARMYEHLGIPNPIEEYKRQSVEQRNAEFYNKLKAQGLQ
jgi:hypothetical protein